MNRFYVTFSVPFICSHFFSRLFLFKQCDCFFLYTLSLLYLKATKIWKYRQQREKNQFSFHAHRRRLAHKIHSLFSFSIRKNCISYSNANAEAFVWLERWQFTASETVCGFAEANTFNNKIRSYFLFLRHVFALLTFVFNNMLFDFYGILFYEMDKSLHMCCTASGYMKCHWAADTCNWRQKPLRIELFSLLKQFNMITMNIDSNSKRKEFIESNQRIDDTSKPDYYDYW